MPSLSLNLPNLPFGIYTTSKQLISGSRVNHIAGMLTSGMTNIVALAGGGFAGAFTINTAFAEFTTVATANDSGALPPAKQGLCIYVTNSGVASLNIFPQPADNISGAGAGVAAAVAVGATIEFICTKNGIWRKIVTT